MDAPKKIWLDPKSQCIWSDEEDAECSVEYIRADLVADNIQAALNGDCDDK